MSCLLQVPAFSFNTVINITVPGFPQGGRIQFEFFSKRGMMVSFFEAAKCSMFRINCGIATMRLQLELNQPSIIPPLLNLDD